METSSFNSIFSRKVKNVDKIYKYLLTICLHISQTMNWNTANEKNHSIYISEKQKPIKLFISGEGFPCFDRSSFVFWVSWPNIWVFK